jgi:DNA polymerase III subunit beta
MKTLTRPVETTEVKADSLIALKGLNVTVSRLDLVTAIESVFKASSTRSSLPILTHVHLKSEDGKLYVSATDLEVWITTSVAVTGLSYNGEATAPSRLFRNIIKRLKASEVTIVASVDVNPNATMTEIVTGKTKISLYGLEPEEFPLTPQVTGETVIMKAHDLRDNIKQVLPAISHDETRAILTGIYTKIEAGNMRMVCTDTHRLIVVDRPCQGASNYEDEAIIPGTSMTTLLPLLSVDSDVKVTLTKNQIMFEVGNTKLITRLIDGQFPNYARVIPNSSTVTYTIDRAKLLDTLAAAEFIAIGNSNRVTLRPNAETGMLNVFAESGNLGKFTEDLPIEIDGVPIDIAFNAGYLHSILSVMTSEKVKIGMTETLRPGVITQYGVDGWQCVLMPMQIV